MIAAPYKYYYSILYIAIGITASNLLVNLSPNLPAQLQLELRARVASKIN